MPPIMASCRYTRGRHRAERTEGQESRCGAGRRGATWTSPFESRPLRAPPVGPPARAAEHRAVRAAVVVDRSLTTGAPSGVARRTNSRRRLARAGGRSPRPSNGLRSAVSWRFSTNSVRTALGDFSFSSTTFSSRTRWPKSGNGSKIVVLISLVQLIPPICPLLPLSRATTRLPRSQAQTCMLRRESGASPARVRRESGASRKGLNPRVSSGGAARGAPLPVPRLRRPRRGQRVLLHAPVRPDNWHWRTTDASPREWQTAQPSRYPVAELPKEFRCSFPGCPGLVMKGRCSFGHQCVVTTGGEGQPTRDVLADRGEGDSELSPAERQAMYSSYVDFEDEEGEETFGMSSPKSAPSEAA